MLYRSLLEEDMLSWMQAMTGIALNGTIDLTCSKYEFTGKYDQPCYVLWVLVVLAVCVCVCVCVCARMRI